MLGIRDGMTAWNGCDGIAGGSAPRMNARRSAIASIPLLLVG
jgi:hypothetical protein